MTPYPSFIGEPMYIRSILALALMCFSSLSAGIEDYFKPCPNKSPIHKMKNIDFIYTINLDQRPEKFESCTSQLTLYGIYPYRFSAVNGWELSLQDINKLGVQYQPGMDSSIMGTSYLLDGGGQPYHDMIHIPGRTYFCHCMARGPIGIVLSHCSILQDAYDSGYETIWVMEDDIQVIRNPNTLSDLIVKLDSLVGHDGWDILFTDQDTKNSRGEYVPCLGYARRTNFSPSNPGRFSHRQDISPEFRKVGARYGAYSMIVRRSGMKKILDFIKTYKIFFPYDMDFCLPNDIRFYAIIKDVVSTQPNALSDNGGPNYIKK